MEASGLELTLKHQWELERWWDKTKFYMFVVVRSQASHVKET